MHSSHLMVFTSILVAALILAAFFSFAETSLMAINRYRLRYQARLKKRYAILAHRLLKRPDRLLGVTLIGNTFAVITASTVATLIATYWLGERGAVLSAILLAIFVLIFTEMMPKTLAALHPERVVQWIVWPTRLFLFLFYPVVWLMTTITNFLLTLLRVRVTAVTTESLSRDELRSIVYDTTGKLSRKYQNMLLGILDLSKLTVDDVMMPKRNIEGLNLALPWDELVQCFSRMTSECMPCYRDNINHIVGVLYLHDLLPLALSRTLSQQTLLPLLREPYFIPEGTSLSAQLTYFQACMDKLAFVVDEYGDILGSITLDDILEEIVGNFTANMDHGKRIVLDADHSFWVEGSVTVRELNRIANLELPTSGARTLNGLIVEYLESLPRSGVTILIANHPIEIVAVKDNRVKLAHLFPSIKQTQSND